MHVIGSLHGGGAERLLTNLVTQQHTGGGDDVVVCVRREGVFLTALQAAGVETIDLDVKGYWTAVRGLYRLVRLIRLRRPAVIQGWMYPANLLGSLALRLAGRHHTRVIWGIFSSEVPANVYPWVRSQLFRDLGRIFSPYTDGVIYNAQQALDFHRAIGFRETRALVIPNCLDLLAFQRDPAARVAVRRELGIPDDAIVVVMAARVDPMKDWKSLLDTVRDLPGVVAVGIGVGTDHLPAQPGFIGLGWRDDVARIYSAADIFLLTSAFGEGTSLALVEAMACRLPSVVTAVGGNGTIVGDAGLVVPPRDVRAARTAVMRLARDKGLREIMGESGRARVATGHSADHVAGLIEDLATSTAEGPSPGVRRFADDASLRT